ncbi:MAG TPA: hypothetical protein VLD57_04070 [Blastocatellia bacterium]|nr:hypothetical protein [Blastocatellia bacterium]
MRKLSLLIAIIIALTGFSANAQKKQSGKKIGPPVVDYPKIVIEDEGGGGYIVLQPSTGVYTCVLCKYNGYTFESRGETKIDGCNIYLTDIKEGYSVLVSVDICTQQGTSAIEMTKEPDPTGVYIPTPMKEYWKDSNLADARMVCDYKQPGYQPYTKPEPNPPGEVILQNDDDGSFLLIDLTTGSYKFIHCEDGTAMSGTGVVRINGCAIDFEVLEADRRILATIDACMMYGKAAIELFSVEEKTKTSTPKMQEFISDENLLDNVTQCGPKK